MAACEASMGTRSPRRQDNVFSCLFPTCKRAGMHDLYKATSDNNGHIISVRESSIICIRKRFYHTVGHT
jgi:hypothetical protein